MGVAESDGEPDYSNISFAKRVENVVSEMNGFRLLSDWMTEKRAPIDKAKTDESTTSLTEKRAPINKSMTDENAKLYRHLRGPDNSYYALVPRKGPVILRHDHVGLSGHGRDAISAALKNYSSFAKSLKSAGIPITPDEGLEQEIYSAASTLGH